MPPPVAPPPTQSGEGHYRKRLIAAAAACAVAVAGVGAAVGHVAWQSSASSSAGSALAPAAGSVPAGLSGSGSGGSGFSGSGFSGYGSGFSGYGSASSSSASGSDSTASGGPTDAASIAKVVDAGLVDINTVLGYNQEEAAGTGMVLTSNGEVLTNNHVIDGATSLSATDVNNGKTYKAIVVGYDRTQDIAVLQLENASGLKTVTVGDSSGLSTGEAVVGIGNAGGTGGTPSYAGGSITALNQSITASDEGSGTSEQLTGLIGSNANIEPGDSGGPLVDAQGRVIGMDTAASSSSGYEGISFQFQGSSNTQAFSIPIKEALTVAGEIEAHTTSSVVHIGATPFLGIEVESASDADSASIGGNGYGGNGYGGNGYGGNGYGGNGYGGQAGSTPTSGALIAGLISGTPAASAGLSDGDTITSLGGHAVTSADSLSQAMAREKPGESVNVIYVDQDGQSHTALVRLASGPPQ